MGAGDLGLIANSCQTNEYTSTDSSFVFGSVAYDGYLTPYSETCASLMGVTYSTSSGVQYYNDIVIYIYFNLIYVDTSEFYFFNFKKMFRRSPFLLLMMFCQRKLLKKPQLCQLL